MCCGRFKNEKGMVISADQRVILDTDLPATQLLRTVFDSMAADGKVTRGSLQMPSFDYIDFDPNQNIVR